MTAMLTINDKQNIVNLLNSELKTDLPDTGLKTDKKSKYTLTTGTDSVEISDTAKAFDKVNDFLNLGRPDRLDTGDMTHGEKTEFLKMLSILLEKGIVGYEILEVDGKSEKHFIAAQIGDERLRNAKLYDENK